MRLRNRLRRWVGRGELTFRSNHVAMVAGERKVLMSIIRMRRMTLVAAMLFAVACLGLSGCASTGDSSNGNGGGDRSCDIDPGQQKCLD